MLTTRERLHQLIDQLPESELDRVGRLLDDLRAHEDPVLRAFLEAPDSDESLTDEDRLAIEEGWEDIRAGRVASHDEVMRRLHVR